MARYRLAKPAQADIKAILKASQALHGDAARKRYGALLAAALQRIASEPDGPLMRPQDDLGPGIMRFHIRHGRSDSSQAPVGRPVHVI
jgi:toxin ParE1/3/4